MKLNITAEGGAGNLLGNLLCAVAGLLDGATGLNGILANLTNSTKLLGRPRVRTPWSRGGRTDPRPPTRGHGLAGSTATWVCVGVEWLTPEGVVGSQGERETRDGHPGDAPGHQDVLVGDLMNRGIIGTIIGVLVIIVLVIVILPLTRSRAVRVSFE